MLAGPSSENGRVTKRLDPPVGLAKAADFEDAISPARTCLLGNQASRPEICCFDETRRGAGPALACRPVRNTAHRSTPGSDQSPARIPRPISRGTESSNPSPSSSESDANLSGALYLRLSSSRIWNTPPGRLDPAPGAPSGDKHACESRIREVDRDRDAGWRIRDDACHH